MKLLTFATLAACCAAGAAAAPADDMVGTWECRQPGVKYGNKPPILYVDAGSAKAPGTAAFALEIDGFTRQVYGNSDVTADADGWWKIVPSKGDAFMVRPEGTAKSKVPSMELKRAGAIYRCLRLPPVAARSAPPSAAPESPAAPAAPAAAAPDAPNNPASAAPSGAQGDSPAAAPAMQGYEPAKKEQ
jgi:pyruvate/2-oxoglutarate dehydrogenase complex dihydrolipoamide acyltransferase (E2) component